MEKRNYKPEFITERNYTALSVEMLKGLTAGSIAKCVKWHEVDIGRNRQNKEAALLFFGLLTSSAFDYLANSDLDRESIEFKSVIHNIAALSRMFLVNFENPDEGKQGFDADEVLYLYDNGILPLDINVLYSDDTDNQPHTLFKSRFDMVMDLAFKILYEYEDWMQLEDIKPHQFDGVECVAATGIHTSRLYREYYLMRLEFQKEVRNRKAGLKVDSLTSGRLDFEL